MRKLIARLKLAGMGLICLLVIPTQSFVLLFTKGKPAYLLPQLWHIITCALLGLKVRVVGRPVTDSQILFVGNHLSHFDIFVLGKIVRGSYVAKEDLAKWPFIGLLARLQQTAFISRDSGQASQASQYVRDMIEQDKTIILFPEGTSTRGETVLDFKSSLFALPLEYADKGLRIQPFTIRLLEVDGKPAATRELRDTYAWDRDNPIDIGPHIWNFANTLGARLEIIFHDPIVIGHDENRKKLARRIQEIVAAPLEQTGASV